MTIWTESTLAGLMLLITSLPQALASSPKTTCIFDHDIVNTSRPDDHTLLFNMRDHTVWKNTLQSICFGLKNEIGGFTYQPTDPGTQELCSNQVTIKLNTFGDFCQLGDFVRVK